MEMTFILRTDQENTDTSTFAGIADNVLLCNHLFDTSKKNILKERVVDMTRQGRLKLKAHLF